MPERLPAAIHEKLTQRLTYYEDLGIQFFYRTRKDFLFKVMVADMHSLGVLRANPIHDVLG